MLTIASNLRPSSASGASIRPQRISCTRGIFSRAIFSMRPEKSTAVTCTPRAYSLPVSAAQHGLIARKGVFVRFPGQPHVAVVAGGPQVKTGAFEHGRRSFTRLPQPEATSLRPRCP